MLTDIKLDTCKDRILALDGVRAIAILFVLIHHYGAMQIVKLNMVFTKYFEFFTSLCWSGVDLFFVLSGFLVGGILIKNKDSKNYFKSFYVRRICRIFPLYYLIFIGFLIFYLIDANKHFSWLMDGNMPLWSYATFTQNFFMSKLDYFGANWLGITWSLALEKQFYLLAPVIIFFSKKEYIPYICLGGIILAPIFRLILGGKAAFVLLICRMDSLLVGVFIAYLFSNERIVQFFNEKKALVYFVFGVLLFGISLNAIARTQVLGVFRHSWLAFLYGVLVIIAILNSNNVIQRVLRNHILTGIGVISYGIYMYHQLISGLTFKILLDTDPKIGSITDLLVTLLSLAFTFIVSYISYNFFEKYFLGIGKKFNY